MGNFIRAVNRHKWFNPAIQNKCIARSGLVDLAIIAKRLGMEQPLVSYHLQKTSELKKLANEQLERGFFANTIAEKLGWPERNGSLWHTERKP